MPKLRQGEARASRRSCRPSPLHEAVCLVGGRRSGRQEGPENPAGGQQAAERRLPVQRVFNDRASLGRDGRLLQTREPSLPRLRQGTQKQDPRQPT